jgi:MFS family permease
VSDPKHAAQRQATFGEVFAIGEFRALFTASAMSWLGDYLARAAVTALVFTTSRSIALSAATFAISYVPGLTVGPLLAAVAERYAYRRVMVACDLVRAALIACVAIPGLPIPALLTLLFATALLNPPFDASRSAMLPRVLEGDRYVVGVAAQNTANTTAQVLGYVAGGLTAPFHPRASLLIDAVTFLVSAACIRFGTTQRAPVVPANGRKSVLRETIDGFRLVGTDPVLRSIAAVVLVAYLCATVPEGLAAGWAGTIGHGTRNRGIDQALIMMASPIGAVAGALVIGRLVSPGWRRRLIRPLAVVVPLALVPLLLVRSVAGISVLAAISGFAVAGMVAPANGLFVSAVPVAFRARSFGVMTFGLQLVQGVGVVTTGMLADHLAPATAVGAWGVLGVLVMLVVVGGWPSTSVIDATVAKTRTANAAAIAEAEADIAPSAASATSITAQPTASSPAPRTRSGEATPTGSQSAVPQTRGA